MELDEVFSKVSRSLSPNREPKTEKDLVRYVIKAMALEACTEQNTALQQCFQRRWFPVCSKEQSAYWRCYRKETIRLRKYYNVY